ncbi:uncharacterized protein LOC126265719 [Aethina tumida]|uniref:uncharacterized protein LOC126265719 n=1 Tax=Aethina tumida TaxID=116153 RepID=UPI002148D9DA|nr:uncharacterized protein LOC126265719 [Aethina tumida]
MKLPILALSTMGAVLAISILFYIFTGMTPDAYLRISFKLILCGSSILVFCFTGQILIDVTSEVFDAVQNCPWYLWNVKTRKTLLIFMDNVKKPETFQMSEEISLDYTLILKLVKTIFSTATGLKQFSDIHKSKDI